MIYIDDTEVLNGDDISAAIYIKAWSAANYLKLSMKTKLKC